MYVECSYQYSELKDINFTFKAWVVTLLRPLAAGGVDTREICCPLPYIRASSFLMRYSERLMLNSIVREYI